MSAKHMTEFRLWYKVAQAAIQSRSTHSFYDNIACIYDDVFIYHKVHAHHIAHILAATFSEQNDTVSVLDLGCGTGILSMILARSGFKIIGMDISLLSLCRLKQKTQPLETLQADADCLPIKSGSLDAVVCLGSWRHFRNIERVTTEISRVLHLKGICIVGYFPPAIAGIINVNHNWRGQLLYGIYGALTRKLGYWDRTDCLFVKETEAILNKQFKEVWDIESGSGKQLIVARYPKPNNSELFKMPRYVPSSK